jgi:hypothetical protein
MPLQQSLSKVQGLPSKAQSSEKQRNTPKMVFWQNNASASVWEFGQPGELAGTAQGQHW